MKTIAKALLRLYPKAWRIRYGEEMSELLDDHTVTLRTLMDLAVGATKTQLFWERIGLWRIQYTLGCALLFVACLFGYAILQQNLRRGANFPQQTIVSNVATAIASGAELKAQIPANTVRVQSSLSPFVIVYDNTGTVLGSNVRLHGHTPTLPAGVLDYTRTHGMDKITWQPKPGVRIAAVIEHYDGSGGGFVLSGRSLRVVEKRETSWLRISEWTWAALVGIFSLSLLAYRRRRHNSRAQT